MFTPQSLKGCEMLCKIVKLLTKVLGGVSGLTIFLSFCPYILTQGRSGQFLEQPDLVTLIF